VEIPDGEKIAKKTKNEKLGILGGISILGTTGFVNRGVKSLLKLRLKLQSSMTE